MTIYARYPAPATIQNLRARDHFRADTELIYAESLKWRMADRADAPAAQMRLLDELRRRVSRILELPVEDIAARYAPAVRLEWAYDPSWHEPSWNFVVELHPHRAA